MTGGVPSDHGKHSGRAVGIVVVSHSARLAAGVEELAAQMGGGDLRLATAAGLDLPGHPIGTDAARVARAIDEVWTDDGVLVLMDLGSAVLSAEMALDLLPEERRRGVILTAAPLVEGAIAAAVAASAGLPLEAVAGEARAALTAKTEQLGPGAGGNIEVPAPGAEMPAGGAPAEVPAGAPGGSPDRAVTLRVRNRLGLHARPAAALVRTAAAYDAAVTVTDLSAGRGPASARSLSAVATLGVRNGDQILVRAAGPQADAAVDAIMRLAGQAFGEPCEPPAEVLDDWPRGREEPLGAPDGEPVAAGFSGPPAEEGRARTPGPPLVAGTVLRGLSVSPGIATAVAWPMAADPVDLPDAPSADPDGDWAALERAVRAARDEILAAAAVLAGTSPQTGTSPRTSTSPQTGASPTPPSATGAYDAAILDAHALLLEDEAIMAPARELLFARRVNVAQAWWHAVSHVAGGWETLDDPYQRARAADVRDVGRRVLRHLLGRGDASAPTEPCIVLVPELTVSAVAALPHDRVLGVAAAAGGTTSHGAVLARSRGIPVVTDLGDALLDVPESSLLVLDGDQGTATVAPEPALAEAAAKRRAAWLRRAGEAQANAARPAVTRDGQTVLVVANLAAPGEAGEALAAGADGVGLFRTELVFQGASRLPAEDEQERTYRALASSLGGRPLTIRTLDAGADKPLAGLSSPAEQNPFLGVRGLRLSLRHPDLLAAQLRAVCRVAADHPLKLMFPMVTGVDELRAALSILDDAWEEVAADGGARRPEAGIMVEVPAAALLAEAFLPCAEFFSLGTNDLAQYTLAADRGNAAVAGLADALHPAVLRLIHAVVRPAAAAGRQVSVCGEMAGDVAAVPVLLGLGIRELSVTPARIPAVKQIVRETDCGAAAELARQALAAESAAAVRALCQAAAGS